LLTRWPRIGVWFSTKANGLAQDRTRLSVVAAASMSATLGRAGIRHRSAQQIAAEVAELTPPAVSMMVSVTPLSARAFRRGSISRAL
jgi:hypothetical protein